MNPEDIAKRLATLEDRLARIESRLTGAAPSQPPRPQPPQSTPVATRPSAPKPAATQVVVLTSEEEEPSLATSILGWGGALTLVLAAAYLIRLAIDTGWLTPLRQVALAAVSGALMVGAGFALRRTNREYAGLLPAGGIAILFLSIYGAHLYYGLITATAAGAAVVLVCGVSLWLCLAFASDLYALFAVAGSYSAPFLLAGIRGSIIDVAIYFSAWSIVFSVFAIWRRRRLIYLLGLYLALIGFDVIWQARAPDHWFAVLAFQTVQFAIFGFATAIFSVRNDAPLDQATALAHLPPLLLFYFLQYALLHRHLPAIAPWIAIASVGAVAALYGAARAVSKRALPGGELLLWAYVAVVLVHAGYIESVPRHWAPWVAFVLVPVIGALSLRRATGFGTAWPIWMAIGLIFFANYLRVVFTVDMEAVVAHQLLAPAYAALLYLGYAFVQRREEFETVKRPLLYAGHVSAMAAALQLLDERIVQSAAWGILAIACLVVSLRQRDRVLGQSSLLMFGAAAGKVLLYDLSGAAPLARIVSLVVLGTTFYFGGLLYQRMLGAGADAKGSP